MIRGNKPKKLENISEKRSSVTNGAVKTPSLLEQTSKIEQKLTFLKQKILQKKKFSVQQKKPIVEQSLSNFMVKIGLNDYINVLIENGIDSFDILKEIKQSELQEIGIVKGHALKIVVHIRKEEERERKKSLNEMNKVGPSRSQIKKEREQTRPTLSQSSIRQKPAVSCSVDSMQTESFPISNIKKSFCLYCFTRSDFNFCSPKCQELYNGMFERYESNLQKAEENFIPKEKPKEQELSDNQEFLQNFDFLFNPQEENIDIQQYEAIKALIKK